MEGEVGSGLGLDQTVPEDFRATAQADKGDSRSLNFQCTTKQSSLVRTKITPYGQVQNNMD